MGLNASRRQAPDWRLIGLGIALMVLGPSVLWLLWTRYRYHPLDTPMPQWALGLVWYGLALFAIGWLLVSLGLRPGNSAAKGASLAALLYFLIGVAWATAFELGVNGKGIGDLMEPGTLSTIPLHALIWPLTLAETLGLFGLTMG